MTSPVSVKRFTLAEYHRLTELGFFQEDDRIELIRGEIIQMAAKGTRHTTCCRNLVRELPVLVVGQAAVQCQDPITLPDNSEPEPDIAIVRLRQDNYLTHHPLPADVVLVIEIADSSLEYDRAVKAPLYAEAGILHYWIFNLVDSCLEAYSEPYQDLQGQFAYAVKRVHLPDKVVPLPELSDVHLTLSKIFPAAIA